MARNSALNFNLPSADDLFSTEEERVEARLEKVVNLSPAEISDFPNHPFKVRMDAAMQEMAESVKQYGVLVPTLVRPKPGGGYEMVAGHRRKKAADLAGLTEIPCIVRQLTDDEATIIMVDSNLQREQILPSEKAFAYKMKLDAMKRQAGRPSKENSVPLGHHSIVGKSRELLATNSPDSNTQIQRYVRLTVFRRRNIGFIFQAFNLIPELTVEQNIIFPVLLDYQKPDRKYLEELLTVLNLKERRNHLPSQLSGGQQQRVAIGRALITRPSLILADEPTGNLDTQNSSEVIALLKEASRKYEQTIIMITHNRSIAQSADRILQVSDGVLTDLGRCRE